MIILQLISAFFEYIIQSLYLLAHNTELILVLGNSYVLGIETLACFSTAFLYLIADIAKF